MILSPRRLNASVCRSRQNAPQSLPWIASMWKPLTLALLCQLFLTLQAWAQTQPISAVDVRLWAASCAACHGTHGKAEGAGLYLAGRPSQDLYTKLMGYKNGSIAATVMAQHAKGYSDEELLKLAEHFSNIK